MNGWAAFWIFMAVFIACDTALFARGYDTFFWSHKTPNELEYQRQKFGLPATPPPQPAEKPDER